MTVRTEKSNSSLRIFLEGELNTLSTPEFEKEYELNKDGVNEVVLDLEKLTYISSSGLRVILCIQNDMEQTQGSLSVCNVNDGIMDIFSISGFVQFLNIL